MMSNREWVQSAIEHKETEAVPYNFMFTPVAQRIVREHYGDNIEDSLGMPIRMGGPHAIKPLYADPDRYGDSIADDFGVIWSTSKIDRGSPIGPCLPEPDLSKYVFPNPAKASRFTDLGDWCARKADNYRILWVGELWERATFMRGMESLLMDISENPGFVRDLLDRITAYILETIRIMMEKGKFECIALSDDYGGQHGLLMSPGHWREFVKPCLVKIYGMAKSHGIAVFHHSCGNIAPIIGEMIGIGLDILHPIQPEAMDILFLKKEFGKHVTFCGGLSTQDLLVSGAPNQVRREVQRLKLKMGKGGGYILEPGITIQADVPRENLIALIDEARRGSR